MGDVFGFAGDSDPDPVTVNLDLQLCLQKIKVITELDMLLQLKYEKHGQIVRMERSFLTHKKKQDRKTDQKYGKQTNK